MTEKQARRPPVAPKPSFIHDAASTKTSSLPSPAIQGASLAFGPGSVKPSTGPASHHPSSGALLAATAAANKKQQQQEQQQQSQQSHPYRQNAPPSQQLSSTDRGRALTTTQLPVAVSRNASTSPKPGFRPHSPRSTSAVAAVAASAKTSPVRRPEIRRDQTGSYLARRDPSQEARARGKSTSDSSEAVQSLQQSGTALAGAIASMTAAPVQVQSLTEDKLRSELGSIPHLSLQSPQRSSMSSPSPSGTAAAATATRNAASIEARKRALSTEESSPKTQPARNVNPSPWPTAGSSWPRIGVTPLQTDSESDSVRPKAEHPAKPLHAPVPLRPSRAALVAQEQTHATNPHPPVLDARTKMTASSLADAMVASSIASTHAGSRRASPASKRAPPIPRPRSKSVGVFEGGRHLMHLPGMKRETGSQTPKLKPLPARPMRHTLRNTSPDRNEGVDERTKRGRRHWRRHPNMHHEGDRKRWRDKITERERKRYEGLWAANRGLLLDHDLEHLEMELRKDGTPANDLVINLVVRDIWERSRLPSDVLEEIWELVSQADMKTLNREEFVVGLWLIDQRLKGRKLPFKVSPSVWSSVRHTHGVKISSKPLQK